MPRTLLPAAFALSLLLPSPSSAPTQACCPAGPLNKPVVNADQTVILYWDPATKTEHFIRQASFKGEADDFGFLVPSPSQPEVEESGQEAFPFLAKVTEPEIKTMKRPSGGGGCGCGAPMAQRAATGDVAAPMVRVLEEKQVGGYQIAVLEADTSAALVAWLKERGYAYSPEVEAWAKPYVGAGWKITAFKVAKDAKEKSVVTSAVRISFKTDRPVFPYREPDYKGQAEALGVKDRVLRIYFLSDARYEVSLTKEQPWTGTVAWADKLSPDARAKVMSHLKMTATAGPTDLWLTEFEDHWPYKVAPADLYFTKDADQSVRHRPPNIVYVAKASPADAAPVVLAALLFAPGLLRRSCGPRRA